MKIEKVKGNFLRKYRTEKGIEIKEVASGVGLSLASIYSIEKGSRTIPSNKIDKILSVLGLDLLYKNFLICSEDILLKDVITRGEYIRMKRAQAGLRIPELSRNTDVAVSTLSCIELSTRNLTPAVYQKIYKKLDMEKISYLELESSNIYMLYAQDMNNIPLIEGFYFNKKDLERSKIMLESTHVKYVWKIKKYEFDTSVVQKK